MRRRRRGCSRCSRRAAVAIGSTPMATIGDYLDGYSREDAASAVLRSATDRVATCMRLDQATGRRCRGRTIAQNAAAAIACRAGLDLDASNRAGPAHLSRSAAPHGTHRARRTASCSSTTARRPMPTAAAPALAAFPRDALDPRRAGEGGQSRRMRAAFRACAQGLYDRRSGAMFARLLARRIWRWQSAGRLDAAVKQAAADARARRHGPAVAGLRVVRPVHGF